MKLRTLLISLLLVVMLTLSLPAVALADDDDFQPMLNEGTITGITPGKVKPTGDPYIWEVKKRTVSGSVTGTLNGPFELTYNGLFNIQTQAGDFSGRLNIGKYKFDIDGATAPLYLVPTPLGIELPKLDITGTWQLKGNESGYGTYQGWVVFVPTPDGHVGQIVLSAFTMTGQYEADNDDKKGKKGRGGDDDDDDEDDEDDD